MGNSEGLNSCLRAAICGSRLPPLLSFRLRCPPAAAQGSQDECSADAETEHGGERYQIERTARQAEVIREQRNHGTDKTENVEPERRMNMRKLAAEPNLEQ